MGDDQIAQFCRIYQASHGIVDQVEGVAKACLNHSQLFIPDEEATEVHGMPRLVKTDPKDVRRNLCHIHVHAGSVSVREDNFGWN